MEWTIEGKGPLTVGIRPEGSGTAVAFMVDPKDGAGFLEWGRSLHAASGVLAELYDWRVNFLERHGVKNAARDLYQLEAEMRKAQELLIVVERQFWRWTDRTKEQADAVERLFDGKGDLFVKMLAEIVKAAMLSEDDRKNSSRAPGGSKAPERPRTATDAKPSSGTMAPPSGPGSKGSGSPKRTAAPVPGS